MTQSSSSPGPSPTLIQQRPEQPVIHHLAAAIAGHAAIVAAIVNHAEADTERAGTVGALHSG